MTPTEKRVVAAFLECVQSGEMSKARAVTILEDAQRYGWMSATAKDAMYASWDGDSLQTATETDGATEERLAELEEALELILSGVTDDEA